MDIVKRFAKCILRFSIVRFGLLCLLRLFYDKRYLVGRHFDDGLSGWTWALKGIWFQKILGFNRFVPWPISPIFRISNFRNIEFHPDDLDNFQSPGCYFQNFDAKIKIGFHSLIAPNVGLITSNHDVMQSQLSMPGKSIVIGDHCWIGMNSVILPGVKLGDYTTVAAGSVVTKSFPGGRCILAGTPASIIRKLDEH